MKINLVKGQKINLNKEDGTPLKKVMVGLGWDPVKSGGIFNVLGSSGSIDLDASCAIFDANKNLLDKVYFGHLDSKDKSIKHTGDNLTGHGDGDDEQIKINLEAVSSNVQTLVITISSFRGQTFDKVENCFARLIDLETNKEITSYKLSEKGSHTGMIMLKLYRHNGDWKVNAIGQAVSSKTINDLIEPIKAFL